MVGSGLAPRGRTHRIPAALHAKPAKPSQAKRTRMCNPHGMPQLSHGTSRLHPATCNVRPASVKTCLQPIDEVRVCFVQRACACRIMVGPAALDPVAPPTACQCLSSACRKGSDACPDDPPGPLPRLCRAPPANSRSTQSVAARSRPKRAVRWADERTRVAIRSRWMRWAGTGPSGRSRVRRRPSRSRQSASQRWSHRLSGLACSPDSAPRVPRMRRHVSRHATVRRPAEARLLAPWPTQRCGMLASPIAAPSRFGSAWPWCSAAPLGGWPSLRAERRRG
jgi:hypothetical protein